MKLVLDRDADLSMVEQIVQGVRGWIAENGLRPGARLPSIRQLASHNGISRSSVIEAYDRLIAEGLLRSRPGAGFFIAVQDVLQTHNVDPADQVVSRFWEMFSDKTDALKLGCGWWPTDWREDTGVGYAVRQVARKNASGLFDYSTPLGYLPLRQHIQQRLRLLGLNSGVDQILVTAGASHALDLIVRCFLKIGDLAFVEDPGYYNLFRLLEFHGVEMRGVPRLQQGPDITYLEELLKKYRPKMFFTNSIFQNPTGTTTKPEVAYQILRLSEKYGFTLVEDDVYADFTNDRCDRLATLDQLHRVIYVGSYSKTLSSSLRVGFIAGNKKLIGTLTDAKMLTSIASSRFAEIVVSTMLSNGSYRKMMERLRVRLDRQRATAVAMLRRLGWEIFVEPVGGMFLWVRKPDVNDADALLEKAACYGVTLSAASIFTPDRSDCPWLRINVAYADDARAVRFFKGVR